jgi:hypothetical protein
MFEPCVEWELQRHFSGRKQRPRAKEIPSRDEKKAPISPRGVEITIVTGMKQHALRF